MPDTIIEIAAKVIYNNSYDEERSERHYATARAVIREVTPLIRAAALERAARLFEADADEENDTNWLSRREIAATLRALKEQP